MGAEARARVYGARGRDRETSLQGKLLKEDDVEVGFGKVLDHLAARAPLVLVLEDLQWADELTLRLISFAARRLEGRPVGLALAARDEELPEAPMLRHALPVP